MRNGSTIATPPAAAARVPALPIVFAPSEIPLVEVIQGGSFGEEGKS